MAQSAGSSGGKRLVQVDISSDTVCPWCFVGKKNLDKAIASSQDQYDFKVLLSIVIFEHFVTPLTLSILY